MGNKLGGARERTSGFVEVLRGRPKRSPSAHEGEGHPPRPVSASAAQRGFSTQRGKLNSCPDLVRGPATDSPRWKKSEDQPADDKKYDIKIYRSYTDLPGDMPKTAELLRDPNGRGPSLPPKYRAAGSHGTGEGPVTSAGHGTNPGGGVCRPVVQLRFQTRSIFDQGQQQHPRLPFFQAWVIALQHCQRHLLQRFDMN